MPSLVFCYAAEDEAAARELARFIEANVDYEVSLGDCRVGPELGFLEAAERALSGDAALILLSRSSVPKKWKRDEWEPVLLRKAAELGTRLGFVQLNECSFPELLRRSSFFDLCADFRRGARQVKHWLMRADEAAECSPDCAALREEIADRPGAASGVDPEIARRFADECAGDFERVFRIACHGRSAAGMLGDIGHAAGLRLAGNVEQNRASIVCECAARRWLFLFEGIDDRHCDLVSFGGRASVLFTRASPPRPVDPNEIAEAFLVSERDESRCGALMGAAESLTRSLLASDFEAGLRLGWPVLAAMKTAARFAESVELLAAMEKAARDRNDEMALFKIEWEHSWLAEDSDGWGVRILPTAGAETMQLSLFGEP